VKAATLEEFLKETKAKVEQLAQDILDGEIHPSIPNCIILKVIKELYSLGMRIRRSCLLWPGWW